MRAIVSSAIRIEQPTPECRSRYVSMLSFDNPEFIKKERMGLWTGGTPRTISLITSGPDWIEIPFGMIRDVFSHRDEYDEIINETRSHIYHSVNYQSDIRPYDYQEDAINAALKGRNGVIVAPCGSGKTQMGLEIIARLGLRALWLTHTGDLLKQSMERAKAVLDIPESTYGTITEGKINIGSSITFATVQTMCRIDLDAVKDEWDIVMVDEAHHIVGTPTKLQMFYKVVSKLCARFKYGLTATPKRSDGLISCMYALLGGKLYEIEKRRIRDALCEVKVFFKDVVYKPDLGTILAPDGTLQYSSLINDLTENEYRNMQVVEDIARSSGNGRRGLVLTDRVKHVEVLCEMLDRMNLRCIPLHGKVGKGNRNQAINLLKNGEVDLIIATFSLAKEGLDIPNLDDVFFTTPQKNETIIVQSAGRVARKAEGKKYGIVHDYVDNFGMLLGWANKRRSIYKKSEYILA